MITEISTPAAPAAIGPYSQATRAGNTVYVSGQIPLDPATGEIVPGDTATQARRCLENVKAILTEAGVDFGDVASSTVLLTSLDDFAAMNAVYEQYFKAPYPARATYQVAALPRGAKVEIIVVAHAG